MSSGHATPELTGKLLGYLTPFASLKFADIPNRLVAISKFLVAGRAQIVTYGVFYELSQDQSAGTAAAAGDFSWKVLTSGDAAEKPSKLAAEIANGRLAMIAIIGTFFHSLRMFGASFCEPGRGDVYTAYFEVKGDAWGGVPCRC